MNIQESNLKIQSNKLKKNYKIFKRSILWTENTSEIKNKSFTGFLKEKYLEK